MFGRLKRIQSISTKELQSKMDQEFILLDVRTPAEYRSGHIRKAKNVPLAKINEYTKQQEKTLYVICQSGMRSKKAARMLQKKGYEPVNIRGGMNQWAGPIKGGN